MKYFLGLDGGGTKTHALVSDETGRAVGFGRSGPGSWESVGYEGLAHNLNEAASKALAMAGLDRTQIAGMGLGLSGYDWPLQESAHREAIASLGIDAPARLVNDAVLGIPAGTESGWGISVVSGTGCNCRGLGRDFRQEGRVVGGAGHWSGEYAGGGDILARALRAVAFEWTRRGPATALSAAFLNHTGAKDLAEFIEGTYLGRYGFDPAMILLVFEIARTGDPQAIEVMRWAGQELGNMAVSVVNQLNIHDTAFDVVLIGSIYEGHPLIQESLGATVRQAAPAARMVRLHVPPVVGATLLGMEITGQNFLISRPRLIGSTSELLDKEPAP